VAKQSFVDARAGRVDYIAVQASPEFQRLKHAHRRFVLPVLAVALVWYFGFVIVAITQPQLMARPVAGRVNLGIVLGLAQFVTTFRDHDVVRVLRQSRPRPAGREPARGARSGRDRGARGGGRRARRVRGPAMTDIQRAGEQILAATVQNNNPVLNIGIFAAFVAITMFIVIRVSRQGHKVRDDFYAGGRGFSGTQNGTAIAGDYLSAASFLGIVGAIAVSGYDGFLYSVGFLVAWLVALLLVAELLRNTGKFTMADVLSFRLRQRPVRMAAAISTLAVTFFYLLAQMAGAGGLVSLLLGISDKVGQSIVIAVVGVLMIVYVLIGGMKGTTWVQIIKAVLLIAGAFAMTLWVLALNGFSLNTLLDNAVAAAGGDEGILAPGQKYKNPLDFISLGAALVLGTAGLPHVLMRFYTVPTAKEARKSVVWAIWLIGLFYISRSCSVTAPAT
jgi:uncharacterized membrane protein (DUF485 family)